MEKTQNVFQRYEKKYLLDDRQLALFMEAAAVRLQPNHYAQTVIRNIYFDTPDFAMIRRSLEKPVYKEKLRLRSYRTPLPEDTVFVELKKKYKGVVYKRRTEMPYDGAVEYLYHGAPAKRPSQVTREIDWIRTANPRLTPAMYISYARTAYDGTEDTGLRVTFDRELLWRREALYLDRGVWGTPLLAPEEALMELKLPGAMPLWLAHLLDRLAAYPVSFSKYGRAFVQLSGRSDVKGGIVCA